MLRRVDFYNNTGYPHNIRHVRRKPLICTTGNLFTKMLISQLILLELMYVMHFINSVMLLTFKQAIFIQKFYFLTIIMLKLTYML